MQFPLNFGHITLFLAVSAIILLITAELSSPHYGQTNLTIDNKRLKKAALTAGILSLSTFIIHVYQIIAG
jgi:hypothetical protein